MGDSHFEYHKLSESRISSIVAVLRSGWVFLERTQILSGIQFTTLIIDFFAVETKRFVGSPVNLKLTRQTCGQRSSRAADSKLPALENHFSERICFGIVQLFSLALRSRTPLTPPLSIGNFRLRDDLIIRLSLRKTRQIVG